MTEPLSMTTKTRSIFTTGMGLDMNGNYRAGILKGVIHYLPEMAQTIQA